MQIGDLIRRAGRRFGDRPAIVEGTRCMSFIEFDERTDRLGNALLARGLTPGDRVAVLLPNGIDGIVVYYALAKAGLVRVPLNSRETTDDHAYKIKDSGARCLVYDEAVPATTEILIAGGELEELIAAAPGGVCAVDRLPDDPLRFAYTGGTTGKPKAVVLTTRSEWAEVTNMSLDLLPKVGPQHTMLHAAPVTHGSGGFLLPHLIRGARNVILKRFEASAFLEAAERERATASFLVPTMVAMLLEEPNVEDARLTMQRLCYGGAPIAATVLQRAIDTFGPVLAQTYGQAEAPLAISCLQPDEHDRISSAGRPYTFVDVEIRDEDGRTLPPGEPGEVVTRGPHTMAGYWQRPLETAQTLDADGWLHTGDIGQWDADGYLYLLDRRGDMIISGGFNVYPREVEDVLLAHPAVREAAVVGLPDEQWGERVAAAVVLRAPTDTDDLVEHCRTRLAGYKRPRLIEEWPQLPKSPVGKSLRRAVRDRMAAATRSTHPA